MATISRRAALWSFKAVLAAAALGFLGTVSAARAQEVPAGYPKDYADVIAAAKKEGKLLIYSNMSVANWKHLIDGFNKRYPGIVVDMLDVGSRESIERYLAEASTGVATADLIATASQTGWIDLDRRKELMNYASPETGAWPEWSRPLPGLYTVSTDPLVFAWNALVVPESKRPKTFADFIAMAQANSKTWGKKVTTYSPITSPFGYAAHWYFVKHHGEERGWQWLKALGELPARLENSGGPQMEKVTSGEYLNSYFMSGITVWPRADDPGRAKFIGWNFIGDGQPMMMRGIAIPKASRNVNAAKLMLDYILSADGQRDFGKGGLTPARPGVQPGDGVRHTYSSVVEAIGEKNIIMIGYDPKMMDEYDSFLAKLKSAYRQ